MVINKNEYLGHFPYHRHSHVCRGSAIIVLLLGNFLSEGSLVSGYLVEIVAPAEGNIWECVSLAGWLAGSRIHAIPTKRGPDMQRGIPS